MISKTINPKLIKKKQQYHKEVPHKSRQLMNSHFEKRENHVVSLGPGGDAVGHVPGELVFIHNGAVILRVGAHNHFNIRCIRPVTSVCVIKKLVENYELR